MAIDIGGMRVPYNSSYKAFIEDDLISREPFGQFAEWFKIASQTSGIMEANAMCLATATKDGHPSCRMVLLKRFGKEGFVFFTNYNSRKGMELKENPRASLCFYWDCLKRSIRIEGVVEKIPEDESYEYFQSRPKDSQIGACISPQSQVVPSREILKESQKQMEGLYQDDKLIEKPSHWYNWKWAQYQEEGEHQASVDQEPPYDIDMVYVLPFPPQEGMRRDFRLPPSGGYDV